MRLLFLLLIFSCNVTLAQTSSETYEGLEGIFEIGTVQSMMIEHNGELIYDEFRDGMNKNKPTNIKSASKSVLSLLVGIAIDRDYLEGVEQPIGEFFPDYFEQNPDSVKEAITIKDLLTMRSGLETTSFHNYGRWVVSNNWITYVLSRPLTEKPGGKMVYSTGTSHLLSVILTRATGMSTRTFADEYLFGPLGIRIGGWDRDPQGYYMGGNNLAISPLALLKIGRLMNNMGEYNGRQIVPQSWIKESINIYTRSNFNDYNFGYMWWRKTVEGKEVLFAWGNGGQYIMILPEMNTVISITSDVERATGSRGYQRRIFTFLEQRIIPLLEERV